MASDRADWTTHNPMRGPMSAEMLKQAIAAAENGDRRAIRLVRQAAEMFDQGAIDYLNQPYHFNTKSPIEKAMAEACWGMASYRWVPEAYEDQRDLFLAVEPDINLRFETQAPIGPYVADILLTHREFRVVVECDGHAFHERTPRQAEHDKRRDRYLQAHGYRVLRFTGSEIHRNPNAAALEALNTATALAAAVYRT